MKEFARSSVNFIYYILHFVRLVPIKNFRNFSYHQDKILKKSHFENCTVCKVNLINPFHVDVS